MMRHPEHHHVPPTGMQRNRMNMQQMCPPPPQTRMLMTVPGGPHAGVLVSMPSGPTLITNTGVGAIQHQPKTNLNQVQQQQQQQVYYDAISNEAEMAPIDKITNQQQQQITNTTTCSSSSVPNLANMKEKTPMCLVNELARYNKIQHQYRLTSEQGPAHKKIFTVTLKLGNEEYEAEGASIKKAQHSAAAQALDKTQLKHPPPKTARNMRPGPGGGGGGSGGLRGHASGMVTPTVELNALAMKRGERTVYIVENGAPPHAQAYIQPATAYYNRHSIYPPQGQPRYNYDSRRGHNVRGGQYQYDNRYYGQYKPGAAGGFQQQQLQQQQQQSNGEICTVRLRVGDREYPGTGNTVQAARHDAATKAIEEIKKMNTEEGTEEADDELEEDENGTNELNTELKSPISLVHEIALKRHMNVVFEVKSENGPPHMKIFITLCKIGDCVVEGEGNGKKISKKRAAEKMLERLAKLPPISNMNNVTQIKRKRVATKKKTRNLIKVNSDKPNDFVEDINPISRLIQIQQANKEKEPVYTVLEERGAPRRREFVIQAGVNGCNATGVGPNKKIAKRNAAQALLTLLGYATPLQQAPPLPKTSAGKPDKAEQPLQEQASPVADKPRKVTFMEEKIESAPPVGGSGGRQVVPGLLIIGDQQATAKPKPTVNANLNDEKKAVQKVAPPPAQGGVRSKDKLLYLAQIMNVQVQFSDFPKANHEMYLTLVSLNTTPQHVCHGEGPTTEASHETAALEALNVLSEMGLDNIKPNNESNTEV